jgi:hypothetical protein
MMSKACRLRGLEIAAVIAESEYVCLLARALKGEYAGGSAKYGEVP